LRSLAGFADVRGVLIVARRSELDLLLVTLESDGEELEQQLASSGERAQKIELLLIAKRDSLRHGDHPTGARAD
jgi:hypothetical protein